MKVGSEGECRRFVASVGSVLRSSVWFRPLAGLNFAPSFFHEASRVLPGVIVIRMSVGLRGSAPDRLVTPAPPTHTHTEAFQSAILHPPPSSIRLLCPREPRPSSQTLGLMESGKVAFPGVFHRKIHDVSDTWYVMGLYGRRGGAGVILNLQTFAAL